MFHKSIISLLVCLAIIGSPDATACARRVIIKADTPSKELFKQSKVTYIIKGIVDLHGKTYIIPEGCTLSFKHGSLVNGTIIGDKTKFKSVKPNTIGALLSGSWQCESFSDLYFNSDYLTDNQIMSSINALQSDDIKQEFLLERAEYNCDIPKNDGALLLLSSNTMLRNSSSISINGNNFTSYNIIRIKGKENVTVTGGELHGDVGEHIYSLTNSSQWGHGINIYDSQNVTISDIIITHCIGDGLAISGGKEQSIGDYSFASSKVYIRNVKCDYNRRQGLSIIHATDVDICYCFISNTGQIDGHSPSAGIDIEPNVQAPYFQSVKNVAINNCIMENNKGYGFLTYNNMENMEGKFSIENILVSNCSIDTRVVLYSGGVKFEDSQINQLSFISEKAPLSGNSFIRCTIAGFSGIVFKCSKSSYDHQGKISDIVFNSCDISFKEDTGNQSYGGLFVGKGNTSNIKNIVLHNCKITIPLNIGPSAVLMDKAEGFIELENCEIHMPRRRFPTSKIRHNNCIIESQNIYE